MHSVGINIHLHYTDTLYNDFELVRSRLLELGVRHTRDGLIDTTWQPYYDRHNALGKAGITGVFITSPKVSLQVLRDYWMRLPDAFEAYEAPNEYDLSGDSQWVSTLRATLARLHQLKSYPESASFPIYGPSLTQEAAYVALGDVSGLVDFGNLHNYPGGRHPGTGGWGDNGYGSIDWNLALIKRSAAYKPVVTTETGYWDDMATPNAVPESVAARYLPRLLLEQFRKGILRTYIYELCDSPQVGVAADSGYGLIRRNGSRKPAFLAVRDLLQLFTDPGPAVPVVPLDYTVAGGGEDLRDMAFQKRDGTYLLALWIERSGWDVNTRLTVPVPTTAATVRVGGQVGLVRRHVLTNDGSFIETAGDGARTVSVPLSDTLTVLEFRPAQDLPPAAAASQRVRPLAAPR